MAKKLLSPPLPGLKDSPAKSAEPLWQEAISFRPRTLLGKRLWGIRERIVASRKPLLSWEEIEQEIAAQRGEIE
jgi:hypothetical protein